MVLDYPDWSRVASGSLRYLGTITAPAGGQAHADYAIQPSERSLIFVPVIVPIGGCWAQSVGTSSGDVSPVCYWGVAGGVSNLSPASVVCSAALDPSYTVTVTSLAAGFPAQVAVYASTDPPTISNPGTPTAVVFTDGRSLLIGQQPQSQSIPVVPTSSLPIGNAGLKPSSQSMPVVVTDSQAAGKTGQDLSANSLPVVLASDQAWNGGSQLVNWLPSAARTTTQALTINPPSSVRFRGIRLNLVVTAIGTGSLSIAIYNTSPPGNNAMLSSAAINANGIYSIVVYPGMVAAANLVLNAPAPAVPLVAVFALNANPATYACDYELLV